MLSSMKQSLIQSVTMMGLLTFSMLLLEHVPVLSHHLKHHIVLKVLDKVQHALSQSEGGQVPLRGVQGVHLVSLVPNPYTVINKDHAAPLLTCRIE